LERFPRFAADVAITDLRLPDGNGIELLKKWHTEYPELPVILITAHGAIDSAITALRHGAFDYLQKPFDIKNLVASVRRAAELSQLRQKFNRLQGAEKTGQDINIVGHAPHIEQLRRDLHKIARSKADTVLVLGESGTGKELAARAIHVWSERAKGPFIEINCASIPETLLESELFGYEKGAFTDARERKLGLFEMARNGTIFLDEIGEMSPKLQAKLLRALEYRRFKRLGGTKDIDFSGRIVAATNRNLLEEVAEKRFRDDLFYRLNVLSVEIPPLRNRIADIPELVAFLVTQLAQELEITRPQLSPGALAVLEAHDWPGNVRELKNVLKRAMVLNEPTELLAEHLRIDSLHPRDKGGLLAPGKAAPQSSSNGFAEASLVAEGLADDYHHEVLDRGTARINPFRLPEEGLSLEDLEKSLLMQALEKARNNQTRAAQLLGITRHTLRYRLDKHGLLHQ
jgi:DNA-binding NtrC family response regulator